MINCPHCGANRFRPCSNNDVQCPMCRKLYNPDVGSQISCPKCPHGPHKPGHCGFLDYLGRKCRCGMKRPGRKPKKKQIREMA